MRATHQFHELQPVWDENSQVLILGSFPSVKSRETGFFYGHPQNRFWKVIAAIYVEEIPRTIEEKKELLLKNHIAVWDVIADCDIVGSDDSSIRNVTANDIREILSQTKIERIYSNGNKAKQLYDRYIYNIMTDKEAIVLPSSSPANANYSLERLIKTWKKILNSKQYNLGKE